MNAAALDLSGLGAVASSDPDTEPATRTSVLYQPVLPTLTATHTPKLREPKRFRPVQAALSNKRRRIRLPAHEATVPKFEDLVLPTVHEQTGISTLPVDPNAASGHPVGFSSWTSFFRDFHTHQRGLPVAWFPYVLFVHACFASNFTRTYYKPMQSVCGHECHAQCEFFSLSRLPRECTDPVLRNIYICWESGNLHVCTAGRCEHLQQFPEGRVCRLTQQTHPLELYQTLDYMPTLREQGHLTSHAIRTAERKTRYRNKANRASNLTQRRLRVCKHARLENVSFSDNRVSLAYKIVRELLYQQTHVRFEEVEIDYLVWLCEETWKLVVQSPAYDFDAQSYSYTYHCCMVLYNSREPLILGTRNNLVLLDGSDICAKYLPARSNSAGYPSHSITQAEKYFLEYIDTCSTEALTAFVQRRVQGRKRIDKLLHAHSPETPSTTALRSSCAK